MALCSRKSKVNLSDKKKTITKKKAATKPKAAKNKGDTQPKANLRRGKLPTNWNIYVDKSAKTDSDRKTKSKFPRSLTGTVTTSTCNASSQLQHVRRESVSVSAASASASMASGSSYYGYPHPVMPVVYAIPVSVPVPCYAIMAPMTSIAIDCEMVGVGDSGRENMLARVSLVNEAGSVLYDTFVKPQQPVIDYRTNVSGVRPHDMENGQEFRIVQQEVFNLMQNKLLVGHALKNDLKVLYLSHPKKLQRDTSRFHIFREEANGRTPSLKFLAENILGVQIQSGEHSSVEDARAAMGLYMKFRNIWEQEIRSQYYH